MKVMGIYKKDRWTTKVTLQLYKFRFFTFLKPKITQ